MATLFVLLAACGPRGLRWEYTLPASLEGSAMTARVRAGSCSGTDVRYEVSFTDGEATSDGPRLAPGTYGVEIEARNAACEIVARGCTVVTLPSDEPVVRVSVEAITPEPLCPGMCALGMCTGVDAGPRDAGTDDVGPVDAPAIDAPGIDAPIPDAGPGDECTSSTDCPCTTDTCTAGRCIPERAATAIAAGSNHACAIGNGQLFCWGSSVVGEVGIEWNTIAAVPTRIGSLSDWTAVDSQDQTTCGIAGGAVRCWGSNYAYQGGVDPMDDENILTGPRAVVLSTVPAQVAVGSLQTFVLDAAGALTGFGENTHEQTSGPGTIAMNPVPPSMLGTDTWAEISSGAFFTCGVGTSGLLSCWGANFTGSLGGAECGGCPFAPVTDPTPGVAGPTWAHVSLGIEHACAWDDAGALYCWGRGRVESEGALGTGSPAADSSEPVRVPGIIAAEASLQLHTCVVDTSHALWCFGPNGAGQLGVGDMVTRYVPTPVRGDRWQHVAVGPDFTCATTLEGAVFCWGAGEGHVLGQGFPDAAANHPDPVRACLTR